MLSARIQAIKPSATLAIAAKAKQLQSAGRDILNMGVGEPDFNTPKHIKAAAITAILQGQTKYTPTDGTPELKQAIIDKLARDNQLHYTPPQIIVSAGAKQAFFNLALALLNPGDEVIIPAPYWVSYPDIVTLMGATPVFVATSMQQHFKINASQLAAKITAKTKLLVLNSPNNPTGMVYTRAELAELADVLKAHPHVYIASDDIYEKILWHPEGFANILTVAPELIERTIVINGVSKSYAMTGWRIGYSAGDATIIAAMKKAQDQSTSNPCSISQAAAVTALNGGEENIQLMCATYQRRQQLLLTRLKEMPYFNAMPADGAFYSFINVTACLSHLGLADDIAFADYLLEKQGIAIVPGSAFGAPGYIRLSFAVSDAVLNAACDRLAKL